MTGSEVGRVLACPASAVLPRAVDDGGDHFSGEIVNGEWQETQQDIGYQNSDIVVRMPRPKKPVKP